MGHERLGMLPKTKKWRVIVSELASADAPQTDVSSIAAHALRALGSRYGELAADGSVRTAFTFLVEMARDAAMRSSSLNLTDRTPLSLAAELARRIRATDGSLETREVVQRAAADAIATWHRENGAAQSGLFDDLLPHSAWNALGGGAGFCELSRMYFARLTERYLCYFLEREASAVLSDLGARERFQNQLRKHIGEISRHSFETAKITQSYAAGWFNKNALRDPPSATQIKRFLSYAFAKLREDLRREGEQ